MSNAEEPPSPDTEAPIALPIYFVAGRAQEQPSPSQELSREDRNIIRFITVLLVAGAIAVGGTFIETIKDIEQYDRFNPPTETNNPFSWVAAPLANYYEQFKGTGPYTR